MKKDKYKCPYCSRKIGYGKRLMEHSKGEHTCKHCQKISTVKQDSYIWILLVLCSVVSLIIMVFYLTSGKAIQEICDEQGKMKLLVALFFGDLMIVKWIFWEIVPFLVFYFVSPVFIEFVPQKRFMEQTQTKIDLSVPLVSYSKTKTDSKVNNIQKQRTEFTGVYEDISSSSAGMEKTRSFRVTNTTDNRDFTDVNKERLSKSQSYSSDVPLVRVSHEAQNVKDDDIKEYIPVKERAKSTSQKEKPSSTGNYSGNRKF